MSYGNRGEGEGAVRTRTANNLGRIADAIESLADVMSASVAEPSTVPESEDQVSPHAYRVAQETIWHPGSTGSEIIKACEIISRSRRAKVTSS